VELKTKILIVDDDEVFVEILKEYLLQYKVNGINLFVDGLSSTSKALIALKEHKYDILILDYLIDEMNGKEVVEEIRKYDRNISIIILTGHSDQIPGKDALKLIDIQSYIEKTPDIENKILVQIMSIIKSIQHTKDNNTSKRFDFPTRLKQLRELHGVSQGDLANCCGIKRQQISNYELGQCKPSLDIAEKIADYFDVSLDYLLCRSKKKR